MIRWLGKWLGRALLAVLLLVLALLSPVVWVETACRGTATPDAYAPLLPPEHRRAESRTLLTYPEWHIVHAYDDYARVIAAGDPQDYRFFSAIRGFWSALCPLNRLAAHHGGATAETRMTIYTIGVSFTAELALKAAYEETVGRVATLIRGDTRARLDVVSAEQAAGYARFLQQVPWYKWDFTTDIATLNAEATDAFRDRERRFALGVEYGGKARYAAVIEQAVGQVGADALSLRSIVSGLSPDALSGLGDVTIIGTHARGVEIETPRYRAFTYILDELARQGADLVEIAGNDDILVTLTAPAPLPGAAYSFTRQGYGDVRSLLLVKVADLADFLRALPADARLEHIHDY